MMSRSMGSWAVSVFALGLSLAAAACSGAAEESASDEQSSGDDFVVMKGKGESCSYNLQCGSDLVCRPTEPGADTKTCEYIGEVGEACDENKDCMGGDPNSAHKANTGGCNKTGPKANTCFRIGKGGA